MTVRLPNKYPYAVKFMHAAEPLLQHRGQAKNASNALRTENASQNSPLRRNAAPRMLRLAPLCRKEQLPGAYCAPFGIVVWNEVRLFDFHRLTVETLLQNVKPGIEKHQTGE